MKPVRLAASFKEKVWGSTRLSPWYPDSDRRIGEVWFEADPPLPLLVKLLFTEEALSVQVHPDDEYGRAHENSRGKTEMWHILRADPGARIAMGLGEEMSRQRLREAAESGEIERLLNWVEVKPGDTFHIPAGTIHAIGAGLALCEIQQNSDVTYRLYDYGRPRELHLARGLDVAVRGPWKPAPVPAGFMAHCRYYATREVKVAGEAPLQADRSRFRLLIALEGSGTIGGEPFKAGEAWYVPAGGESAHITAEGGARLLETWVP